VRRPDDAQRPLEAWAGCEREAVRRGFTLLARGRIEVRLERETSTRRVDALLVANGSDPWPRFVRALGEGQIPADAIAADRAFDTWVEGELTAVAAAARRPHRVWFAHDATLDFVQLAVSFGMATRAPCRLAIHPTRGPWFALRGLVVLDDALAADEGGSLRVSRHEGSDRAPCRGCPAPCVVPSEVAFAAMAARADATTIADAWLAVRDACPVGRTHRYGAAQLGFHMGTSRASLLRT